MKIKHYLLSKLYRFVGLTIYSNKDLIKGKKDIDVLKKKFPRLKKFNELYIKAKQKIDPYYKQYISTISSEECAISLELSTFLMVLCDILKPKRILDCGSGFSSFVFRLYMSSVTPEPTVWSVDTSLKWLEKTRKFLDANDLPFNNLITWRELCEDDVGTFDLILHDLGLTYGIRKNGLQKLITLSPSNGIIVIDDINRFGYETYTKLISKKFDLNFHSLKPFTIDKFGRFSWLLSH